MVRTYAVIAALVLAAVPGKAALAQVGKAFTSGGTLGPFLTILSDRIDHTIEHIPKLGRYLLALPQQFDLRTTGLLIGIVVAGLLAELVTRQLLRRLRHAAFARHGDLSPLRGFMQGALLDAVALLVLWGGARFVAGAVGDPDSVQGKVAHQILMALLYWRVLNFVFRTWLHPGAPQGRMAPVDDDTARRLLLGMNAIILLPMLARHIVMFMTVTSAGSNVIAAAIILYVPAIAAAQIFTVWHWRHDMAAWLAGMVRDNDLFRAMKLAMAHDWWVAGVVFYLLAGIAALYAAVTANAAAMHGLGAIESMLILLLLLETVIHRRTRHLPTEAPTVGEVVAACVRLAIRLVAILVIVDAVLIDALGVMSRPD